MHTPRSDVPDGFSIPRFLPAAPNIVWDAWVDPDAMTQWWHPRGSVTPLEEIQADVQVGAHYRVTTIATVSGDRTVIGGTYRELEPPNRIAFTWGEPGADAADIPLVVVTFEPADHGTLMIFELRGASGAPGDHFFYDGWAQALDALGDYLATHHEGA